VALLGKDGGGLSPAYSHGFTIFIEPRTRTRGAQPAERRGGRTAGVKNKATMERETLLSRGDRRVESAAGRSR
jgi:hypothetical protein